MMLLGGLILQQRTFEADPRVYERAKFNVVLQSKMEISEGSDQSHFFGIGKYKFDSTYATTISATASGAKSLIQAGTVTAVVNGRVRFRLKAMDPILFVVIGSGRSEMWSPESAFRIHLFYPLNGRSFSPRLGEWLSQRTVSTSLSTMKIEPNEMIEGFDCFKFSHKFSSPKGESRLDLFETIWLRKVDNSTQRIEWDVRQSGTDLVVNVKKLKMYAWRSR
jgi:hypothetical protein